MTLTNIKKVYDYVGLSGLLRASYYDIRSALSAKLGQQYIKRQVYDFDMWLNSQDRGISRALLRFGQRELEHRHVLQQILEPNMTVLDIGANIGYYVLIESRILQNGKIIAVEPVPSNIALLKRNLTLNNVDNVTVIQGAISESHSTQDFHLSHHSNLGTFHKADSEKRELSGEVIPVETWTVHEIANTHGVPDIIRMDVEGHEVTVLNSMLDDIINNVMSPMILFETHRSTYTPENDMQATLQALFQVGYQVHYLGSSNKIGAEQIKQRGYQPIKEIKTDFMERSIFEYIGTEDAIDFICHIGGVRTVLLSKS